MKSDKSPPMADANEEIVTLVETVDQAEQRLGALTAGEVDTVTNRDTRRLLLRRTQDHTQHNKAILDALPAHVALLDPQGVIISVNEAWRQFALTNAVQASEYGVGANYLAIFDGARGAGAAEAHQAAAGIRSVLTGASKNFAIEYPGPSLTEQRWLQIAVTPLSDDQLDGAVVMHLDITERRAAEAKIQRHTQLYAALSQCNEAIVHCTSEEALFQKICRTAVQFGGMKMAWVGLLDPETLSVKPVASFGDDTDYLQGLNISSDADSLTGGGPTGTAIREKQPFWCQHFMRDPVTGPWHAAAARAGFAASASLPLYRKGRVAGAFSLYSDAVDAFDEPARNLLIGMAADIGFALDNFVSESERKHSEESLKNMAAKYHTVFELSTDAIMLLNEKGFLDCNEATLRMFGYPTHNDFISKHPGQLSPPTQPGGEDSMSLANQRITTAFKNGSNRFEWMYSRLDGAEFPAEVLLTVMELDGKPVLQAVVRDITERKEAEDRISHLNRVYAVLSGINSLVVRVTDRDELFRGACRIAIEAGGFRMAMLCIVDPHTSGIIPVATAGKDESLLTSIKTLLSSSEAVSKTMIARAISGKTVIISNDSQVDPQVLLGGQYAESGVRSIVVLAVIVEGEAEGALVLYAPEKDFFHENEMQLLAELAGDIAFAIDHIKKQERLNYLAYYDVLTGLANRTLFLDRVAQYMRGAVSDGHKLAIGLIDLERFKNINDSLGRNAGDELLKQVAEWLTLEMGDANLLARIDTDHFAIVVPEVTSDGALAMLVENLMTAFLQHPFRLNDAIFRISIKFGIALFPDDGSDADTVFRNAEAALKKAKLRGDRYLFHTREMTRAVAIKLDLENQLRLAIDNEEFVLHYQPKVNLMTGQVTSAEALIRWNNPRTGLVPPGQFIPILEETGLIYEVGHWALRKAIEDSLRWRDAGLPAMRIAVNVSPLQLHNFKFIDELKQVIALDARVAAGLELEITESVIMANVEHNITSLQAIRAMGITIAIDDFGTGFSSLSYLARLPVDTLKIDRSFVIEMTAGPDGLALVSTIINLAHAMKLKVVAEGVETEEQSRMLHLLNCNEIQGFLFSPAVPAELFETRFLSQSPPSNRA
ncbi:MAG: sensor domain-containing phosphodiesterase [Thiobacillus sp.]